MIEAHVLSISVTPLGVAQEKGIIGEPSWKPIEGGGLQNLKRGKIDTVAVEVSNSDGKKILWDQYRIMENPGSVIAPIRRINSGAREKYIIYFILVMRPVVESLLNSDVHFMDDNKFQGITSIEFPRGVGSVQGYKNFSLDEMHRNTRIFILSDEKRFATSGEEEMLDEAPQLMICPGAQPMLVSGLNPNTSNFATNQSGFIVPVSPDTRDIEDRVSSSQSDELIKKIIPIEFPYETDKILEQSEKIMKTGIWNRETPVIVDNFTLAMLAHIERYIRSGKIPVTQ